MKIRELIEKIENIGEMSLVYKVSSQERAKALNIVRAAAKKLVAQRGATARIISGGVQKDDVDALYATIGKNAGDKIAVELGVTQSDVADEILSAAEQNVKGESIVDNVVSMIIEGTTAKVSFAKLRDGSWGVRIEGGLSPQETIGKEVIVKKRDGSTSTVVVGTKVWGNDEVTLYTIASSASSKSSQPRYPVQSKKYSSSASRSGAEQTKICWECGLPFTYRDAKRNGGDWYDSYCGC
jgi:hypothetical protein